MSGLHSAKLYNAGTEVIIEDPEALRSAKMFKHTSDAIWEQHRKGYNMAVYGVPSVISPEVAIQRVNAVATEIDKKLVVTDGCKSLKLIGMRGEKVTVPAKILATPQGASVSTFNWDERFDGRRVQVGKEYDYASFTDGHRDYARELSVGFRFQNESSNFSISYVMQRYQYGQGEPISISVSAWNSSFAETGYEGSTLHSTEMTPDQEEQILRVIADIGGISLEGFDG